MCPPVRNGNRPREQNVSYKMTAALSSVERESTQMCVYAQTQTQKRPGMRTYGLAEQPVTGASASASRSLSSQKS
jgi:hypothetical protein